MEVACANIRLVLKKEVIMWLNNGRTEVVKQLKKAKKPKKSRAQTKKIYQPS